MNVIYSLKTLLLGLFLLIVGSGSVHAQFTVQWLDIGTLHNYYVESGALHDAENGLKWPSSVRGQGHHSQKALWIGAKDWTDPDGKSFPYYVARIGPSDPGAEFTFPVQNLVIGRTVDTVVEVDGSQTFDNLVVLDAINPDLAADRMIHNIHHTYIGVTVDRRAYAYVIRYDANGDGRIQTGPFDFSVNQRDVDGDGMIDTFGHGLEEMTKNQWVVTSRDSMFQVFQRGISAYAASNNMTVYPIAEAPHAPPKFEVFGRPDGVDLQWENPTTGPGRSAWQVYRSSQFWDNIYEGCIDFGSREYIDGSNPIDPADPAATGQTECGYQLIATLDGNAASYSDTGLNRGTDYFYYLQAIGLPQPNDPDALTGTPGGAPLRSSQYMTQTYLPVNLKRAPYGPTKSVRDARIVPNPVNLGADSSVRFAQADRVAFFNIPGNCTIKIYSEIGELVHTIEHTNGTGDELWNLTTTSRQLIVSGIYIAVFTDHDTGEEAIQKFTVIR